MTTLEIIEQLTKVTAQRDAIQARAVAAEVALATIANEVSLIASSKNEEIRNDRSSGEATGWDQALSHIATITPDLTAARELIRKAGEADALARTVAVMREALGNVRQQIVDLQNGDFEGVDGDVIADRMFEKSKGVLATCMAALALTLPESAKIAAAEREKAELLDWYGENRFRITAFSGALSSSWGYYDDNGKHQSRDEKGNHLTLYAALKAARSAV